MGTNLAAYPIPVQGVEARVQNAHQDYHDVKVLEKHVEAEVVLNYSAEALTTFLEHQRHDRVACWGTAVHHLEW